MKFIVWIGNALSHNIVPSSKRLMAFMFSITICYCEIYNTMTIHAFESTHLAYLLSAILILAGVATIPQIAEILRGNSSTTVRLTKTEDATTITKTEDKTT